MVLSHLILIEVMFCDGYFVEQYDLLMFLKII